MKYYSYEYIWLDVSNNILSKIEIYENYVDLFDLNDVSDNENILKPVAMFRDPFNIYNNESNLNCIEGYIVLCELFNNSDINHRNIYMSNLEQNEEIKVMITQHFILRDVVKHVLNERTIINKYMNTCLYIGIKISDVEKLNNEWIYKISGFGYGICDQLVMARYILNRICNEYTIDVVCNPQLSSLLTKKCMIMLIDGESTEHNYVLNDMNPYIELNSIICEKLKT